jgi:hypothetical protein
MFSPKSIENSYPCRKCKKIKTVTKEILISSATNILIVTFLSFSGHGLKTNKNVSFQMHLNLTDFCEDNELVEYESCAIINHNESQITRGCLSCFGDWMNVHDCKVFPDSTDFVLSSKSYNLFYKRNHPSNFKPVFCHFGIKKDEIFIVTIFLNPDSSTQKSSFNHIRWFYISYSHFVIDSVLKMNYDIKKPKNLNFTENIFI